MQLINEYFLFYPKFSPTTTLLLSGQAKLKVQTALKMFSADEKTLKTMSYEINRFNLEWNCIGGKIRQAQQHAA